MKANAVAGIQDLATQFAEWIQDDEMSARELRKYAKENDWDIYVFLDMSLNVRVSECDPTEECDFKEMLFQTSCAKFIDYKALAGGADAEDAVLYDAIEEEVDEHIFEY